MRVLVTGAAGFLGSHLCDRLVADGHEVIGLDNLFTGQRRNLNGLLDHPRFELVRHDVCERFHAEVGAVYHLASPAAPLHYARNGVRTIETNLIGTDNMLRLAREVGARLLFTSTSEIYGEAQVCPQSEDYRGWVDTLALRSVYDEGKRAAETICAAFYRQYGVDVRIVRVHNTFGPRFAHGDGRVVPAFFDAALRGDPILIHGDGAQTRSFCYVDDMIDGLMLVMDRPQAEVEAAAAFGCAAAGSRPPVLNLGNSEEITILNMARAVLRVTGSSSPIRTGLPHPIGNDPLRRCPDVARARRFGWTPRVSLDDGLRRTLTWMVGEDALSGPAERGRSAPAPEITPF